jgi:hypothetical protein
LKPETDKVREHEVNIETTDLPALNPTQFTGIEDDDMETQENGPFGEEIPDDIVAPLTINQVSPEFEAELAQIWQDQTKLREIAESARESHKVASAKMRP